MKPYPLTEETTSQEIFNVVWKHFVVDKNPISYDTNENICRYRDDRGNACAVGIFLDDETAEKFDDEGNLVKCMKKYPSGYEFLRKNEDLLRGLQLCHDSSDNNTSIELSLRSLAKQYSFNIPASEEK